MATHLHGRSRNELTGRRGLSRTIARRPAVGTGAIKPAPSSLDKAGLTTYPKLEKHLLGKAAGLVALKKKLAFLTQRRDRKIKTFSRSTEPKRVRFARLAARRVQFGSKVRNVWS